MSEFGLIRWVRERSNAGDSAVVGIGDDCAVVRPSAGADLLVTTDMLMDGRHFILAEAGAEAVGFKAMAVNISDIAAMAGRPTSAVVAVALPRGQAEEIAHRLQAGLAEVAGRYGVGLVGGDTNAWDGPLVISVTVFGETVGRGPVLRSGAKVGDVILVTGPLGGSRLGRHLRPTPRVREALALNAEVPVHAMIDLSDGLASDLGHILVESGGLGAELEESSLPIHADALVMSQGDGRRAIDHALADGEDFELCLTVSEADADRLLASGTVPLFRIGVVTANPGVRMRDREGDWHEMTAAGFDHFRD